MAKETVHTPEGLRISRAINRLAMEEEDRRVPSPSSVYSCSRQVWARARKIPQDNFPDDTGEGWIAARSGKLTEPLFNIIIEAAGIGQIKKVDDREMGPEQLAILGMAGAESDDTMVGMDWGGETEVLVEKKRKRAQDIVTLHEKGLAEGIANEYGQIQSYMAMLGLTRCFYIAINWSRAELTMLCRKKPVRYSGIYTEWVDISTPEVASIKSRVSKLNDLIENVDNMGDVPREYDPRAGKFPCTWCPVLKACGRAG